MVKNPLKKPRGVKSTVVRIAVRRTARH